MKTEHEIRDHAELGGSKAERWLNCYGSVALSRTVPEPLVTESAKEGTRAHELAEEAVLNFLEYKETGLAENKNALLSAIAKDETIGGYLEEYIEAIWEKILNHSITKKLWGVEESFTLDEKLKMYGIIDFWCIYISDSAQRVGVVTDFKYGFGYVSEKKNAQLAFYACALRRYVKDKGKNLDYVRAIIFQPRSIDYESFREVKFTAKQLDTWEAKFKKAAHAIYVQKKQTLKLGPWCKYCPAQAVCPKYSKEIEKSTALALTEPDSVKLPDPAKLDDKVLAKIIATRDRVRSFLDAVEAFAVTRFFAGKPIPGTKVVASKGRRKWKEDEGAIGKALQKEGIDPWALKLKPISQIEKLIDAADLAKYITKSVSKPILTDESDPRPPMEDYVDLLEENSDE